jgi:hypothetical protein
MDQAGNIAAGAYTVNGGTSIVGYTSLTSTSFRGSSDSSFLSFGVSADTFLYRNAAASWRFGGDAANPPVPQIQSVQNASGNNISGAVWTQIASLGTGDATQAKAWSWKTGDPGVSGSTLQTATEKWYMTGAGALVNTQAVAATSVDGLVLQTSATATVGAQKYSPALHFKGSGWGTTGGAAQSVDWRIEMAPVQGTTAPNARLGYASSVNEGAYEDKFLFENSAGNTFIGLITNGKIKISSSISNYNSNVNTAMFGSNESQFVSGYYLGWASSSTNAQTSDAFLTRGGAANLQLGRAAANPPVPQTQSVQDASGTNISPAKWTFRSSRGTGNAVNTGILYEWQTPDVGVSGTTLQTATAKMALTGDGKLYVGAGTAPTATLHLKAGSTAASSSPLKFTAGPLMSAVEEGAMEFKDHTLYFTTFQVRRSVVLAQEILTAQVQVPASSTTETTVYTIPMAANYLTAGKKINNRLRGTITQRNNVNSFFTVRVKYAGSTVLSFTTPASTVMAALAFTIDIETVCRAIGAAGTLMSFGAFNVQGVAETLSQGAATTVDTTAINTLTITVQANENNAGTGPVNVEMGETICPDHNA